MKHIHLMVNSAVLATYTEKKQLELMHLWGRRLRNGKVMVETIDEVIGIVGSKIACISDGLRYQVLSAFLLKLYVSF